MYIFSNFRFVSVCQRSEISFHTECDKLETSAGDRFDLDDLHKSGKPGRKQGKLQKSKKEDGPDLKDVVEWEDEDFKAWKKAKKDGNGKFRVKRQTISDTKYLDLAVLYDHDYYADAAALGDPGTVIAEKHTATWQLLCVTLSRVRKLR